MRAIKLVEHGTPGKFELREESPATPGPAEVIVKVHACGLNRLDLWTEEGALPVPISLPRTPGCEIAGEVARIGADVSDWRAGERVAVQSNLFCGECEFCVQGEESLCLNGEIIGVQRDGGFAEEVLVPAKTLVRLPESLSFKAAAGLTLAASTAMHMLTSRTTVRSGDWVLVMGGASGVGSAAIQIARHIGAYVIATGSSEEKRAFASSLGAHYTVDLNAADWPAQVRKITNKRGVDIVVEHIGGRVLEQVFNCLARNGTVVTCGATAGREVTIKLWPLFVKQQQLIGSYGRNRKDLQGTLDLAAQGIIKPQLDTIFPLAETAKAFAKLRNRDVKGKIIVTPLESGAASA